MRERGVGHAAVEVLELPGSEVTASDEVLMDFQNERGLADAGVASDEDLLGASVLDSLECGQQLLEFRIASVQSLREPELRRLVAVAEIEGRNRPSQREILETTLEVENKSCCTLVALLCHFAEELEYEARHHRW